MRSGSASRLKDGALSSWPPAMDARLPRSLRIFLSSPDDVRAEREAVRRVIEQLKREFRNHFEIELVQWEWEPLLAHEHFQAQIVPPRKSDITIVVLWSRLGTPLPPGRFPGPVTGRTVTGTEWEFEDALAGYRERKAPDILVYRKRGAVLARRDDESKDVTAERERQLQLVGDFFRRWFEQRPDGDIDVGFRSFSEAREFETLIAEHLRKLIKKRLVPGAQPVRWHQDSPWRGLLAFEPEHAEVFFGRTAALRELRERLDARLAVGCPFIAVIGASGSGKSSLVKAGLIPDLQAGSFVGRISACRCIVIRPSDEPGDPMRALARGLLGPAGIADLALTCLDGEEPFARLLTESPASAAQVIAGRLRAVLGLGLGSDRRAGLLIVVDQLEELFSPAIAQPAREGFVRTLAALARESAAPAQPEDAPPILVVATLRSDFFDRLESLPELARLVEGDGHLLLLPPDATEIEEILHMPAAAAGVRFERDDGKGIDLADDILAAARSDTHVLPLLSYVLDQLWQQRTAEGVLTSDAYERLGRLEGAIACKAEESLAALPAEVQIELPSVLAELVRVSEASRLGPQQPLASVNDNVEPITARWASMATFAPGSARRALIDAFVRPEVRLFVVEGDRDSMRVRVAHECLLTHWEPARAIIERDRNNLVLRARVEAAAALWRDADATKRDERLLPAGLALSEAEDLLARRRDLLSPDLVEFVESSARAVRLDRERRNRRAHLAVSAFALLAIAATVFGLFARGEAHRATVAAQRADREATRATLAAERADREATRAKRESIIANALLVLNNDPWRAAVILREHPSAGDDPRVATTGRQVVCALRCGAILRGHSSGLGFAEFSPDGRFVVTASADETARVWNADGSGEPVVLSGHTAPVSSAEFSPDGRFIVTASEDKTARVWHADGSGAPVVLGGHTDRVWSAAFSSDGRRVVTASADKTARVWTADNSGQPIVLSGHTGDVRSAAFSSDGHRVVTASDDKAARVWNANGSGQPIVLSGHTKALRSAAFSSDGRHVVTASVDETARVWNADGSGEPVILSGHSDKVWSAVFNSDGRLVVTASADKTARVWNADGSGEPIVLSGHTLWVWSATFSSDGRRVITASYDGTARLWNADGAGESVVLSGHTGWVGSAAFSSDMRRVVTASADKTARVWNADDLGEPVVLRRHTGWVSSAASSPDGRRVVTASYDRTALVWNADGSGEPIVLSGHTDKIWSAAFSSNGRLVVTASDDKTARVWDADGSGEPVILRGHTNGVSFAAFSPDGRRVVTTSADKTARVWNADGSDEPVVLSGHTLWVWSAAFSSDGSRVVTASYDGTARVWNADGSGEPVVISGHSGVIVAVAFSPDGRLVVTASYDGTARVWNADGSGEPVVLSAHSGWVSSAAFSPDGRRVVTGSADKTARVWNADGSGEPIVLSGHTAWVSPAAFSPDGRRVVTGSADKTARVWNADGSGEPVVLSGHSSAISSAAFSPDGRRVVTTSADGTARVWLIHWPVLRRRLWAMIPQRLSIEERRELLGFDPIEIEPILDLADEPAR
jgi:WD40 repeat protein